MGDLEPCKRPVHCFKTDLETCRSFEHAGMLDQGGVCVGFKLLEELSFVNSSQSWRTTRRNWCECERAQPMFLEVSADGRDFDREVLSNFTGSDSRECECHDS